MTSTVPSLAWLTSPWDGEMHAFRKCGEVSEALCTHSAPTARLTTPGEGARHCMACLLTRGAELADKHSDDVARWDG